MESVTHNNIFMEENKVSAKGLWKAYKGMICFGKIFKLSLGFQNILILVINKLVDVGIDLPQDILWQTMHSDKNLMVQFFFNHLMQSTYKNQSKSLIERGGRGNLGASGGKRCMMGYHNPKQDRNHSVDLCWHLHPEKAPEWGKEAQAKWQADKNKSNFNYYLLLVMLWMEINDTKFNIVPGRRCDFYWQRRSHWTDSITFQISSLILPALDFKISKERVIRFKRKGKKNLF
ncbi:hypothetical protein VP01_3526g2 [Puccinia sorghi]|uniref:Uncharacterized protein n=1 Tax=Puccinia sorghi TaxID=27349 RepID=A0A0L6UWD0_9BASI|nr:hypothetical protein VP01_3526g2 [Puccinia sorghi]